MKNLPIPTGYSVPLPTFDSLDPQVLKTGIIALLVLVLIFLVALTRRHIVSLSLRGLWSGFVTGVIGILLLEAAIFIGVKDYIIGDKAIGLPKNIRIVLEDSRQDINSILGIQTQRPQPTAQTVVEDYKILSPVDSELVQGAVCKKESGKSSR